MSVAFQSLLTAFAEKHHIPPADLQLSSEIEVDGIPVSLIFEGDERTGELLFLSEIAKPAAGEELRVYVALLEANHLWAGTDGATLSLNPDGVAVACTRFPLEGLTTEMLEDLLDVFADMVRFWRTFVVPV